MKKNKYLKIRRFADDAKEISYVSMVVFSLAFINGISVALIGFIGGINFLVVATNIMLSLLILCMSLGFANSNFFKFSSDKDSGSNRGARGLLGLSLLLIVLSWAGFSSYANEQTIKNIIAAQSSEVGHG